MFYLIEFITEFFITISSTVFFSFFHQWRHGVCPLEKIMEKLQIQKNKFYAQKGVFNIKKNLHILRKIIVFGFFAFSYRDEIFLTMEVQIFEIISS